MSVAPTQTVRGLPEGADPLSAMTPRFNLLARGFARRYFRGFDLDEQTVARLRDLEARGTVVYVMRYSSRLDYFLLNTVLERAGLRLSAFANGIRFHRFRPLTGWMRIAFRRKHAQPKALDRNDEREHVRTLVRGGGSLVLFLRTALFRTWLRGRRAPKQHELDLLEVAVRAAWECERPVFLVPLALFWRKGPRSESRFLNFNYGSLTRPSDFAKVATFLATYNSLAIKIGEAIDLTSFIESRRDEGAARIARKVRRSILIYLYREEKVVAGPTLRAPGRVMADVLADERVRVAIEARAREAKNSPERARQQAEKIFREIAARMNSMLLAIFDAVLRPMFRRMFSSIDVDGLDRVAEMARLHPIVLLPNHRSYFDFLILSVLMYEHFLLPPHIGARDNMAFGPFGFLFRRVGAFFLRPSFDDPLYKEIFRSYLSHLVREGFTQEFFIEGGRSRTGKSLAPRLGMLGWQLEAFIDSPRRDFLLVPVAVNYERLVEESSMIGELRGEEKKKESMLGLVRARKYLQRRFGSVHLTFDAPISLAQALGPRRETFRASHLARCEAGERARLEREKREFIETLGLQVVERINGAVVANATSVAATVLLGSPERGILRREMTARVQQIIELLRLQRARQTKALEADAASFDESIAFLKRSDLIAAIEDPRGEILYYEESRRRALDLYRNSIAHFLATPSCIARTLLRGATEKELRDDALAWHELLYREFFVPGGDRLDDSFRRCLTHFADRGYAELDGDRWQVTSEGLPLLRCLAEQTQSVIEAYRACCASLAQLSDPGEDPPASASVAPSDELIDRKELRKRASEYFEHSALLGEAARPEAANDATFSNVLDLLVERAILVERRTTNKRSVEIRYARGENWGALTELQERLAAAVSYR